MIIEKSGKVVKGLGGLYETLVYQDGNFARLATRAKGALRKDEEKVLIGDNVTLRCDTDVVGGEVISRVQERKNSLIRPPLANLDYIFVVFASVKPSPILETVDKLTAIALHNGITPVIVITKTDLDAEAAHRYKSIYDLAGFDTFAVSAASGDGIDNLSKFIRERVRGGRTAAFSGASGVGKSTLMNVLFPHLSLATAEISRKIERGRHTTRHVELFPLSNAADTGFIADTPGFSLIDFDRFDFMAVDELIWSFPDVSVYNGKCRYADCAHVGEGREECAVAAAEYDGKIATSRLSSYRSIYSVLKNKNKYE